MTFNVQRSTNRRAFVNLDPVTLKVERVLLRFETRITRFRRFGFVIGN